MSARSESEHGMVHARLRAALAPREVPEHSLRSPECPRSELAATSDRNAELTR